MHLYFTVAIMLMQGHGKGLATYIMLWPEDVVIKKEDVRGLYDGSIFYRIAEETEKKRK